MTAISEELFSLLDAGHVWRKTDTGRQSTVLFVANRDLKGKAAKANPPVVTYLSDDGKLIAVSVEQYVDGREYFSIDTNIQNRVLALFSQEQEQPKPVAVDEEPDDVVADPTDDTVEGDADEEPTLEDVDNLSEPGLFAQFFSAGEGTPTIDAITLAGNIVQYEQDPNINFADLSLSVVRHKLVIALKDDITIDTLNASFNHASGAFYAEFAINGILVNWESYQGAYPVIAPDGMFASIVFTTSLYGSVLDTPEQTPAQDQENNSFEGAVDPEVIGDQAVAEYEAPSSAQPQEAVNPPETEEQPVNLRGAESPVVTIDELGLFPQTTDADTATEDLEPKFKVLDDTAEDTETLFGGEPQPIVTTAAVAPPSQPQPAPQPQQTQSVQLRPQVIHPQVKPYGFTPVVNK